MPSFVASEHDDDCKRILVAWLRGWPQVEGWRFLVSYDHRRDMVLVRSSKIADDGKLWSTEDAIPMLELERCRDFTTTVAIRAASRFRGLMQAVEALKTNDDEEENA